MATAYSTVYNAFLGKITDFDILEFEEADRETTLKNLLKSACPNFKVSKDDLSDRDDDQEQFNVDLSDISVEIISELMIVEWLKPKLYKSDFFENVLNTKDFSMFSPANLLKEVRETYNQALKNAKVLMIDYSYRD
jgi:hypothetical protein